MTTQITTEGWGGGVVQLVQCLGICSSGFQTKKTCSSGDDLFVQKRRPSSVVKTVNIDICFALL